MKKMKFGKQYIVEVSEEGIVPVEEFDKNRFFDKDHDELDFLTEAEKEDVAITTLNNLFDKVWDLATETTSGLYDNAISDVIDLINKFKQDIRSEGSSSVNTDKSQSDEISRTKAKQIIEKICETYKISYGDSYGGFGKALYHAFDKPNSTENLSDTNADECPCDKCRHDGGDIECSGCGDNYSHFEPKKSVKQSAFGFNTYVTYDSKGEIIGVSDYLQIDKCENYGGYIINADTHEVCYQSTTHYCKHGNYRINKENLSDVEKAITFAETWLDMHEGVENPHSYWFYQTVLGILKKVEKLANSTNMEAILMLFPDSTDASRVNEVYMNNEKIDFTRLCYSDNWANAPYKLPNSNKDKEVEE